MGWLKLRKGLSGLQEIKPLSLPPGRVKTVVGIPKFPQDLIIEDFLIENPEHDCFPEELRVMPVVKKTNALHSRRISVTVRNMSDHHVTLRRGTPFLIYSLYMCSIQVQNRGRQSS